MSLIIDKPTIDEKKILREFSYIPNTAYLHTDTNLMPNKKNAWSSWNSISTKDLSHTCITYWLNKLQNLKTKENYFLTLNPIFKIKENKLNKISASLEDKEAKLINAQDELRLRSQRVMELEKLISKKDSMVSSLKNSINKWCYNSSRC